MSTQKSTQTGKSALFMGLGVVVVALLAAFLYLGEGDSNGGAKSQAGNRSVAALSAAAQGTVANFTVAKNPKTVADIGFVDGAGAAKKLSNWRGQVVLLNVWATWCGPCREEMPALDRLQAQMGAEDFEVVALSVDRGDIGLPQGFYEEIGVKDLGLYHDGSAKAGSKLGVFGMPTTLLLGRQGQILGRLVGPAEWDEAHAQALVRAALALPAEAGAP
ncbi:MAG: redoxin family protein [Parvibaculaceae bacterium]|nr:redoxin family protein [Parvibaculaceae bacterium]